VLLKVAITLAYFQTMELIQRCVKCSLASNRE
jgi:hypothetical protein